MARVFLSEWAFRLIPLVTSVISFVGLWASLEILGIAKREHAVHKNDSLRELSGYMHRNAYRRAALHSMLITSGTLVTIATFLIPLPEFPQEGWYYLLWLNYYVVGGLGTVFSVWSIFDLRLRVNL